MSLPSLTKTSTHRVELGIHRPWGISKSYYRTTHEAYEVAQGLMAEGWTVSIVDGH